MAAGWARALTVLVFTATALAAAPRAEAKETPWLGVVILDSKSPLGATVVEVIPGTPADDAGLIVGDVVTEVSGKPVHSASGLIHVVTRLRIGDVAVVKVARMDTVVDLKTKLSPKLTEDEILKRRLLDKKMPPFALQVLTGKLSGSSVDHVNDVMVLFFSSTVCSGPCAKVANGVEEMRVASESDGLAVLGVLPANVSTHMVRRQMTKDRLGYTTLRDGFADELRVRTLRVLALPALLVVDRRGFIRYAAMGDAIKLKDVKFAVGRALGKTAAR